LGWWPAPCLGLRAGRGGAPAPAADYPRLLPGNPILRSLRPRAPHRETGLTRRMGWGPVTFFLFCFSICFLLSYFVFLISYLFSVLFLLSCYNFWNV
jgi:hypothetical protein